MLSASASPARRASMPRTAPVDDPMPRVNGAQLRALVAAKGNTGGVASSASMRPARRRPERPGVSAQSATIPSAPSPSDALSSRFIQEKHPVLQRGGLDDEAIHRSGHLMRIRSRSDYSTVSNQHEHADPRQRRRGCEHGMYLGTIADAITGLTFTATGGYGRHRDRRLGTS